MAETGKIYRVIWLAIFISAAAFISEGVSAQKNVAPRILRYVKSEKKPDAKIEEIIRKEIELDKTGEYKTEYYYNFVDLNGDKKNEVLVYVEGFINCGTGGCNSLLLRQNEKGEYELMTFFSPVRSPIIVSQHKTKGWQDLIFFNSGGGIMKGYYSVSKFNGKSYIDNPTVDDEAAPLKTRVKGIAYLTSEKGIKILPEKK